jgi:hypothetical protein
MKMTAGMVALTLSLCGSASAAFALQASDPASQQSGKSFSSYEACRVLAAGEVADIDECASSAIDAAAKRLASNGPSPERLAAAKAFSDVLPLLGDIGIVALGQGEESVPARIAVIDAAVALAEARADLLSGGVMAPGGSFALFSPRKGAEMTALTQARTLWLKSRTASCAAYPVTNCAVRYDGLLGIFARKAGIAPATVAASNTAQKPRAKSVPRRKR